MQPRDWTSQAVVYGIDVTTFADSNGDGVGDFRGLTQRLPYLVGLGVTCVWLLPFYKSTWRDNGYDIIAHDEVDPRCGTLQDVDEFLAACDKAGIRVLVDLVVNHTSDKHPWFQRAEADPHSPYRDYYIWADDPSTMPAQQSAFPGEVDSVWTYSERAGQYYFHNFYPFQPGLNLANRAVRQEVARITAFWLARGISGFRLDSAALLLTRKGPVTIDDPQALLEELHRAVHEPNTEAVLLGEVDVPVDRYARFYQEGQGLDLLLNFPLTQHLFLALAQESVEPLLHALHALPQIMDRCHWVTFLRNLDELNLGRLTDSQRRQVFTAWAPEEKMRIYGRGIRRRLAPILDGDHNRLLLAWSLLFTMPGIPLFVYGDELGMGDCLDLPGRNAVRTPMQWSDERHAGFSCTSGDRLIRPVIETGRFSYRLVNVEREASQSQSLLRQVTQMLAIRRRYPALAGKGHRYEALSPSVMTLRVQQGHDEFLAIHNLGSASTTIEVPVGRASHVEDLFDPDIRERPKDGTLRLCLPRYGFRWFRRELTVPASEDRCT